MKHPRSGPGFKQYQVGGWMNVWMEDELIQMILQEAI